VDELKNRVYIELIGDIIAYSVTASRGTGKPMAPLNSGRQIGLSIHLKEVLIADEGFRGYRFKNWEIGDVFASALRTSGDTAKRTLPLDSTNRNTSIDAQDRRFNGGERVLWTGELKLRHQEGL